MLRVAALILTNAARSSSVLGSASHVLRLHDSIDPQLVPIVNAILGRISKISCIDLNTRWAFNKSMSLETFKLRSDKTCCASPNNTTTYLERMPRNDVEGGVCTNQPVVRLSPVFLKQQAVDERGEFHHTQRHD